jgi:hypothetical protein
MVISSWLGHSGGTSPNNNLRRFRVGIYKIDQIPCSWWGRSVSDKGARLPAAWTLSVILILNGIIKLNVGVPAVDGSKPVRAVQCVSCATQAGKHFVRRSAHVLWLKQKRFNGNPSKVLAMNRAHCLVLASRRTSHLGFEVFLPVASRKLLVVILPLCIWENHWIYHTIHT